MASTEAVVGFLGFSAEDWQAFAAVATALIALFATVVALIQLNGYFREQWARGRPYIVVDFAFQNSGLVQVEIRNISSAVASDVQVRVDPPFQASHQRDADTLNRVFSSAWQMDQLAPGRRILHVLDTGWGYDANSELPRTYTVEASYRDADTRYRRLVRNWWVKKSVLYRDTFQLNFALWSESALEVDASLKVASSLEKIGTAVGQIARASVSNSPSIVRPTRNKNVSVKEWLDQQ